MKKPVRTMMIAVQAQVLRLLKRKRSEKILALNEIWL